MTSMFFFLTRVPLRKVLQYRSLSRLCENVPIQTRESQIDQLNIDAYNAMVNRDLTKDIKKTLPTSSVEEASGRMLLDTVTTSYFKYGGESKDAEAILARLSPSLLATLNSLRLLYSHPFKIERNL